MHYIFCLAKILVMDGVTGKSQLTGNDFGQFYRECQGHEVGLGLEMELCAKGRLPTSWLLPVTWPDE